MFRGGHDQDNLGVDFNQGHHRGGINPFDYQTKGNSGSTYHNSKPAETRMLNHHKPSPSTLAVPTDLSVTNDDYGIVKAS